MRQSFLIEGRFPGLNDLLRVKAANRFAYNAVKRKNEAAVVAAVRLAGLKPMQGPVHIRFVWIEASRRRDPDNIAAGGRKFILDALVDAGILPGDGWKHIDGWTDRWGLDKSRPRVEVEMEDG